MILNIPSILTTHLCPTDPFAIPTYMLSWLNLWTSMSARQIFQGIYGVQMTYNPNGSRTASVRKPSYPQNSHSCARLWLLSAHGYLFYKLSYGHFLLLVLGDVCVAPVFFHQSHVAKSSLRTSCLRSVEAIANQFHRL
jgi:hypothetical protein